MTDPSLALGTRSGLPDALRVLLETYPRELWEADPGFSQLIRFWLDRHLMFRRLLDRMQADAEARLDTSLSPESYARALSRFGGTFVGELHMHHNVEDSHYFPVLAQRDARLEGGFGLLDADHHALEAALETFVERANAVLQSDPPAAQGATGVFHDGLTSLAALIDRHLTDEEELVVPVLLKYGERGLG